MSIEPTNRLVARVIRRWSAKQRQKWATRVQTLVDDGRTHDAAERMALEEALGAGEVDAMIHGGHPPPEE